MGPSSLSAEDPRVLAMAGTLVVAAAFGAALASGAIGMPGTDAEGGAGPAFTGNVTETPTPSAETMPVTETPTDGPSNDTDSPTDEPVTDPAGDTPTNTGTETDTDPPTDEPVTDPAGDTPTDTWTETDTDTPTDDPVMNPAGDPPTDTGTETDTDVPSDPPTDDPVTDPPTETDTDTETDTATEAGAENQPPEAFISAYGKAYIAGYPREYRDGSDDPDGEIVSREWDFGDGTTATGEEPTHTYESSGNYTITLTVTDDDGATDTVSSNITVEPHSNYPDFFVHGPDTLAVGEEGSFTADREYVRYPMPAYQWDLGNGVTGTGEEVDYAYDEPGNYTVTVTAIGPDGNSNEKTLNVTVTGDDSANEPPDAGTVTAASVPVRINNSETFFANQAEDPDGEIVSYEWEFGDGGTATGERPSHTYDELGEVEVSVTVTDDDGATDTATQSYQVVEQLSRPTAEFQVVGGAPEVGQEARFVAESSDGEDPGGQIVRYEWEFGDGTTATGQNVTHAFDSEGTYNVTLTVTSSDLPTDTTSKQVTAVPESESQAILWYEPDIPVAEQPLRFSVDTPGFSDEVASYEWDFGDGTTATGENAEHTFGSEGTYNVTVTVTTTDGRTITDSRDVEVRPTSHYPLTALCYEHSGIAGGDEIEFRAMSTPPNYANADRIEWDLGDGTTATGRDVNHAYDEPGVYEVSVTKTVDGESNTVTESISVGSGTNRCTDYR